MKKMIVGLLIAAAMICVAVLASQDVDASGSETGMFPNRVFEVTKTAQVPSDWALYGTSIEPLEDCMWWVELTILGGSAVTVTVHEVHKNSQKEISFSELTEVGQASENVSLKSNFLYYATFKYIGKPGTSVLQEKTDTSTPPVVYVEHDPISIWSDDGFTEENGVVGGSGTVEDPYVISGWEINSTTTHCIQVVGTNAPFVIRNCFLHGDLDGNDSYYQGVSNILLRYCTYGIIDSVVAVKNDIGIRVEYSSDVRVSDTDLSGNWYGAYAMNGAGLTFGGSVAKECKWAGIWISNSAYFSVVGCDLSSNRQQGLAVSHSGFGTISDNLVADNGESGILLISCGHSMEFYRNDMRSDGIHLLNCDSECYDTLILEDTNTVNGLPVMYYTHQSGLVIDGIEAGHIIVALCDDVVIRGMTFVDCDIGITVAYSSECFIMDCVFLDNDMYGVNAVNSDLVNITFCQASHNRRAVNAYECGEVHLAMNFFDNSSSDAIGVVRSGAGAIMSCILKDNYIGIGMQQSSRFTIAYNQVMYSEALGVNLASTSECLVYHNDFVGFGTLAQDSGTNNLWNEWLPVGGNYWADYLGIDEDGDGIGDEPRAVPPNGVDYLPLMEPIFGTTPLPYEFRAPIIIIGDDDFTAENGVVSGNGTWQAPYLIEGWDIAPQANSGMPCISIRDTTAIFVIRDCYVHDTISETAVASGIRLSNTPNAIVKHVLLERCAPGISASDCSMLTIEECVLKDCAGGIQLHSASNGTRVHGCTVAGVPLWLSGIGGTGISVWGSYNVSVSRNVVRDVDAIGILVAESDEVRIYQNTISECLQDGIRLQDNMTRCEVSGNSISKCANGVNLWLKAHYYSPDGVIWYFCDWYTMDSIWMYWNDITNCSSVAIGSDTVTEQETPITGLIINGNSVWDCPWAAIRLMDVGNSVVTQNSLNSNGAGVLLYSCSGVRVYHNNILYNAMQAYDDGGNIWDDGYPSGGNYWTDYAGTDSNGDGIGDTPYEIPVGSMDNYPLMTPY